MTNFRNGFAEYYPPSEGEIDNYFKEGLICLDANVLLDAYRFNPNSRDNLLRVLKSIERRLWIPHQVALEFHRNRINAISGFEKKYREATSALDKLSEHYSKEVASTIRELAKTIALSEKEKREIISNIEKSILRTKKNIDMLRSEHGISLDEWRSDSIIGSLSEIIEERVGLPFNADEAKEAKQEAERRLSEKIPPGYMDSEKPDSYGDYFVWRQMLVEAAKRKDPLLFVTGDEKEDWFRKEKGRVISARPELIREAQEVAGVSCAILSTRSFLHHANRVFKLTISEDVINQMGRPLNRRSYQAQNRGSRGGYKVRISELREQREKILSRIYETETRIRITDDELNGLQSYPGINDPNSDATLLIKGLEEKRRILVSERDALQDEVQLVDAKRAKLRRMMVMSTPGQDQLPIDAGADG
ncbi:PIN-like domain-containing protein [Nocardiopsis dassonvillei]|uniref:PIN-like domain-containing protein n=1 Tax=Nocardiopsis dassonvillei TaxID=2014 RepID=UPI00366AA227